MPDSRTHRGAHPEDERLFSPERLPALRAGCHDLSWLLSRGYSSKSALKLVGDRYALTARQRMAVARATCSDEAAERCRATAVPFAELAGEDLWIDGYNVLTSIEAAMAGGIILVARDSCFRDLASMHGSWRKVAETEPAIDLLGRCLEEHRVQSCHWLLDRPVSNSGRLRALLMQRAAHMAWDWHVQLEFDPDRTLRGCPHIVASSDREILAHVSHWLNLARYVIEQELPGSWIVDLTAPR
jgi:hypothetical protein